MKILVTFALENEFAPWRALRKFRSANWGPVEVFLSETGSCELAVVLTGAGPRPAALEISRVVRAAPDFGICISSGLAGALKPEYGVEQILAARTVVCEASPIDAADISEDGEAMVSIESSAALISFAGASGATIVDKFYTSNRAVSSAHEKEHFGAIADAVEMESFEILRSAASVGIPAVAIRAVSDGSDEDLPFDMNEVFTEEGRVSIPRVIGQLTQRPQALPSLVRLGKHSRAAAESLARFLEFYIVTVVNRMGELGSRVSEAVQ